MSVWGRKGHRNKEMATAGVALLANAAHAGDEEVEKVQKVRFWSLRTIMTGRLCP